MAKRLPNDGAGWSPADLKKLKALAKSGVTAAVAAKELGRTAPAVQQKGDEVGNIFPAGSTGRQENKEEITFS